MNRTKQLGNLNPLHNPGLVYLVQVVLEPLLGAKEVPLSGCREEEHEVELRSGFRIPVESAENPGQLEEDGDAGTVGVRTESEAWK